MKLLSIIHELNLLYENITLPSEIFSDTNKLYSIYKKYLKHKDEENKFIFKGSGDSGKNYGELEEWSKKYVYIKDFIIELLKQLNVKLTQSSPLIAKTGTIYIETIKPKRISIRISDHEGRTGDVYQNDYEVSEINQNLIKNLVNEFTTTKIIEKYKPVNYKFEVNQSLINALTSGNKKKQDVLEWRYLKKIKYKKFTPNSIAKKIDETDDKFIYQLWIPVWKEIKL